MLATSFQIAIASGASIGSFIVNGFGPTGVFGYSVVAFLAGATLMLTLGRRIEQR